MIDSRRPLPRYRRIAAEFEARIKSGELQPGDLLPSAEHIGRTYGVGSVTAKKVLAYLSDRWLIVTEPGQRARVRKPVPLKEVWLNHAEWTARFPTDEEQDEFEIGPFVHVAVVKRRNRVDVYPVDRIVFIADS